MLCKLLVRVLGVGSGRVMVAKVDESNVTGRGGGKQGLGFVEVGILFKLEEAQSSDSKPARLLQFTRLPSFKKALQCGCLCLPDMRTYGHIDSR